MSDLFVGEALALVLLVPPLLRPFFRRLQRVEGIAILPLLSLFVFITLIVGSGLRLSVFPAFAFSLLAFLSALPRMVRFFRRLPTDIYSIFAKAYNGLLLVALVAVVWLSAQFVPELPYIPSASVRCTHVTRTASDGAVGYFTLWNPERGTSKDLSASAPSERVVVLSGGSFCPPRNTLALILAENGWTVIAGDFYGPRGFRDFLPSVPLVRRFLALSGTIAAGKPFLSDAAETAMSQSRNLDRLIRFAREEYGSFSPIYAVGEGDSAAALLARVKDDPESLAGAVCVASATDAALLSPDAASPPLRADLSGMLPPGAGSWRVFMLTAEPSALFGYGEIRGDDILAAALLGSSRDVGRKQAELAARKIVSWLDVRRTFNDNQ